MAEKTPRFPWERKLPKDLPIDERGGYTPPKPIGPLPDNIRPPLTPVNPPADKSEDRSG